MSIESGLWDRLRGDSALVALVGDRIWPVKRRQNTAFPAVVFTKKRANAEYELWSGGALYEPLWEFECLGETYSQARACADRLMALFDRFRGLLGGHVVVNTFYDDEKWFAVDMDGEDVVVIRLWFRMQYQVV